MGSPKFISGKQFLVSVGGMVLQALSSDLSKEFLPSGLISKALTCWGFLNLLQELTYTELPCYFVLLSCVLSKKELICSFVMNHARPMEPVTVHILKIPK